ncbi:MAG: 23S rRNA (adenine(2503)-C(2))-methyltransferase RlmN [Patescibacteria group bacterium]|nr:23S rRNA (adenine(2503)-C(2))-methyltransferase RlmN [Patescibacteria group bacterium]
MDLQVISDYLSKMGEPDFRLKQIKDAYFKKLLPGFEAISNLPTALRHDLASKFTWQELEQEKTVGCLEKGAVKALLRLSDGLRIESVLMVYRNWITACLSVMVGCPLGCSFCATGQMGFKRNLNPEEIVDQIVFWNQYLTHLPSLNSPLHLNPNPTRISRIVFMGMGEPFLNWENTWEAIKIINDKDCLNIGSRHITISTVGIIPKIYEFADLETQINLAISLHSPFQVKREEIMPSAKQYPVSEIMKAAKYFVNRTNRKLFFEYALINNFNDRPEDAAELRKIFTESLFHLNLINLNPTQAKLNPATENNLAKFMTFLDKYHLPYTLRRSVGEEIKAACGQLAIS